MGDWPPDLAVPVTIRTGGRYGKLNNLREVSTGTWSTNAWGTVNLAQFVPIMVPFRYPVRKLFVYNFTTINGNLDVGIYSESLEKLYSSGSVAHAGANGTQFLPAAGTVDLILDPGLYYLALASSSATATFSALAVTGAHRLRFAGLFEQLTALPLPAAATPAAVATVSRIPLIGITQLSSPVF